MLVLHLWLIFIHIFSMFVSVCRPRPVFLCICVNRGSCRTSPRLWEEVGSVEQIFLLSFLLFCFISAAWALCITRETHACGEAEGGAERKMLWHDFFSKRTRFLLQPPSRDTKPCFHVQDKQQRPQHHSYYSVVFTACHRIFRPISFGGLSAKQRHRTWLEGRGEADRKKFYEGGDLIRWKRRLRKCDQREVTQPQNLRRYNRKHRRFKSNPREHEAFTDLRPPGLHLMHWWRTRGPPQWIHVCAELWWSD